MKSPSITSGPAIRECKAPEWLKTGFILDCFAKKEVVARKKYQSFVEDMIGKEYESPLTGTIGSSILGSPDFVENISSAHLKGREDANIPALRQLSSRPTPEEIIDAVKAEFADNEKLARQAAIHLCHKYSGLRLRDIGNLFNVRDTAISEASRRFVQKLEADIELRRRVERIKGGLKKCGM